MSVKRKVTVPEGRPTSLILSREPAGALGISRSCAADRSHATDRNWRLQCGVHGLLACRACAREHTGSLSAAIGSDLAFGNTSTAAGSVGKGHCETVAHTVDVLPRFGQSPSVCLLLLPDRGRYVP